VAKVRVYELAKEFGVESKVVMAKLQELGEFVRSASSTIEAPVVRKLKEAFPAGAAPSDGAGPAQPATKKAAAKKTTAKKAAAQPETPLAEQVAAAEQPLAPTPPEPRRNRLLRFQLRLRRSAARRRPYPPRPSPVRWRRGRASFPDLARPVLAAQRHLARSRARRVRVLATTHSRRAPACPVPRRASPVLAHPAHPALAVRAEFLAFRGQARPPVGQAPTRATCRHGRLARLVPAGRGPCWRRAAPAPVEAAVVALAHPVAPAPGGADPADLEALAASAADRPLEAGAAAAAPQVPSAGLAVGVQHGAASPRSSGARSSTICRRPRSAASRCRAVKVRPYACPAAHH
jgi:translation initiation factor IF-2